MQQSNYFQGPQIRQEPQRSEKSRNPKIMIENKSLSPGPGLSAVQMRIKALEEQKAQQTKDIRAKTPQFNEVKKIQESASPQQSIRKSLVHEKNQKDYGQKDYQINSEIFNKSTSENIQSNSDNKIKTKIVQHQNQQAQNNTFNHLLNSNEQLNNNASKLKVVNDVANPYQMDIKGTRTSLTPQPFPQQHLQKPLTQINQKSDFNKMEITQTNKGQIETIDSSTINITQLQQKWQKESLQSQTGSQINKKETSQLNQPLISLQQPHQQFRQNNNNQHQQQSIRNSFTPDPRLQKSKVLQSFNQDFLNSLNQSVVGGALKPQQQQSIKKCENPLDKNNYEVSYEKIGQDRNQFNLELNKSLMMKNQIPKTQAAQVEQNTQLKHDNMQRNIIQKVNKVSRNQHLEDL